MVSDDESNQRLRRSLSPGAADEGSPSKKKNLNAPMYNHRIVLTTYPGQLGVNPIPLNWGAMNPTERGPILASRIPESLKMRNSIGFVLFFVVLFIL